MRQDHPTCSKTVTAQSQLLLCLTLAVAMLVVGPQRASAAAQVSWVGVTGYSLAVEGNGWAAKDHVTFELTQQGRTYGVEVRTTKTGAFELGINNFDCHIGGVGQARDFAGDTAMPPVIDPCGPGGTPSAVTFTVLKGSSIQPKVSTVSGLGSGKTHTIRRGDAIYLWEKGSKSPEIMPSAPTKFLSLIGTGPATKPMCASGCTAGFFWEWVGMKVGGTDITLRPWCDGNPCPDDWVVALKVAIVKG